MNKWTVSTFLSNCRHNNQFSNRRWYPWYSLANLKFYLVVSSIPSCYYITRSILRLSKVFFYFLVICLLSWRNWSMNTASKTWESNFLKKNYPKCSQIFFFPWIVSKKIGTLVIRLLYLSCHQLNNEIVTYLVNRFICLLFKLRSFFCLLNQFL